MDKVTKDIGNEILIKKLGTNILRNRKIVGELISLINHSKNADNREEREMILSQIRMLKNELRKNGNEVIDSAERISLFKSLEKISEKFENVEAEDERSFPRVNFGEPSQQKTSNMISSSVAGNKRVKPDSLEKLTIQRIKKKVEKVAKVKEKKPRKYVQMASRIFHNYSTDQLNKGKFKGLKRDLNQANMEYVPAAYISVIYFSTLVAFIVSIFITLFFLFVNFSAVPPFFSLMHESIFTRFLKVFWIMLFIPGVTFLFVYFYPSLERKSIESHINQELPFAVVHMSSISSSMVEPSKIFGIIVSTHEYPALEKEFTKIQNEINVYGYDLVTALRKRSFNSPSKKLSELLNGLATTINSGGNLPEFFDKRSQNLLFEHRLDKEKQGKASETFMDIYISAVVAAPMILMLLLMMMRISGLGISLSTGMISLIMVLGVSLINIFFLVFLHIKQPEGG